jgi:hypothetical protein
VCRIGKRAFRKQWRLFRRSYDFIPSKSSTAERSVRDNRINCRLTASGAAQGTCEGVPSYAACFATPILATAVALFSPVAFSTASSGNTAAAQRSRPELSAANAAYATSRHQLQNFSATTTQATAAAPSSHLFSACSGYVYGLPG